MWDWLVTTNNPAVGQSYERPSWESHALRDLRVAHSCWPEGPYPVSDALRFCPRVIKMVWARRRADPCQHFLRFG